MDHNVDNHQPQPGNVFSFFSRNLNIFVHLKIQPDLKRQPLECIFYGVPSAVCIIAFYIYVPIQLKKGSFWNNFTKQILIIWIVWLLNPVCAGWSMTIMTNSRARHAIFSAHTPNSTTFCATAWNFPKNVVNYWWHLAKCWVQFLVFHTPPIFQGRECVPPPWL